MSSKSSQKQSAKQTKPYKLKPVQHCFVSILMPIYGRGEYTKMALERLYDITHNNPRDNPHRYEFVLVLNGCEEDYFEKWVLPFYKKCKTNVKLVIEEKRLGCRNATIEGLKHCRGRYIQKVDNDVLMPYDWFHFAMPLVMARKVDAISPNMKESNPAKKYGLLWFADKGYCVFHTQSILRLTLGTHSDAETASPNGIGKCNQPQKRIFGVDQKYDRNQPQQ